MGGKDIGMGYAASCSLVFHSCYPYISLHFGEKIFYTLEFGLFKHSPLLGGLLRIAIMQFLHDLM